MECQAEELFLRYAPSDHTVSSNIWGPRAVVFNAGCFIQEGYKNQTWTHSGPAPQWLQGEAGSHQQFLKAALLEAGETVQQLTAHFALAEDLNLMPSSDCEGHWAPGMHVHGYKPSPGILV